MADYKGKCWDKIKMKKQITNKGKKNKPNTPVMKIKDPKQSQGSESAR